MSEKSIFKTCDAEIQTHLRKGQYFVIRTYDITNVQYYLLAECFVCKSSEANVTKNDIALGELSTKVQ